MREARRDEKRDARFPEIRAPARGRPQTVSDVCGRLDGVEMREHAVSGDDYLSQPSHSSRYLCRNCRTWPGMMPAVRASSFADSIAFLTAVLN